MHSFTDLADRCTIFTLDSLSEVNDRTIEKLQSSGAASLVKTLQMINLQKVILAVGLLSIFEASLQENLICKSGFEEAKKILMNQKKFDLKERFENILLAINVLKHGRGQSYDRLVLKAKTLPFRIKLSNEYFFYEGDVSEVSGLIEVTDEFVQYCGDIISEVSKAIYTHSNSSSEIGLSK